MITLCMDTSHKFLAAALLKDQIVLASFQEECWKRQSEQIFPVITELLNKCHLSPGQIDRVVITKGPGSYTGVRIAMTIAKVFCAMGQKPLYTIGTLQLYAGLENCYVLLDARGKRAYCAAYQEGRENVPVSVKPLSEIAFSESDIVIGDGSLIGRKDIYPDIARNFLDLEAFWHREENVHLCTPEYLKSIEDYMVKK